MTSRGMSVALRERMGWERRNEAASGSTRMLNSAHSDQFPIRVLEETVPIGAEVWNEPIAPPIMERPFTGGERGVSMSLRLWREGLRWVGNERM